MLYAGYFTAGTASASNVSYGVRASASGTSTSYGGYFTSGSASTTGTAYGTVAYAYSGDSTKYGGYFVASGSGTGSSHGVYAAGGTSGVRASGLTCDFDAVGAGTNYCATSSRRWKRDIEEIPDALRMVNGLRGVYFQWDEAHGGQHDVGMVAEEVGEVLPEIVEYESNGVDAVGMDYSMLTPLLVEVVKELSRQNEALQQKIAELDERLRAVE